MEPGGGMKHQDANRSVRQDWTGSVALLDWHSEQQPAYTGGNLDCQPVHVGTLCNQFPIGAPHLLQGSMNVGQVHALKILHEKVLTAKVEEVPKYNRVCDRHHCGGSSSMSGRGQKTSSTGMFT